MHGYCMVCEGGIECRSAGYGWIWPGTLWFGRYTRVNFISTA